MVIVVVDVMAFFFVVVKECVTEGGLISTITYTDTRLIEKIELSTK